MNKTLILLLILFLLIDCSTHTQTGQEEFPNIILLIGDDHGYPYFGFMGADYVQTPHMDQLVAEGTLFTQAYVSDNHCKPSLSTLVTSMLPVDYKHKVDALIAEKRISEAKEKEFVFHSMQHFETLPQLLQAKGYKSFQGGKWWEFKYQYGGFTHGMTTGWTAEDRKPGNNWFKKYMGGEGLKLARATMEPVYEFLDAHKSDPFFIWYAPELPHYPFDAPDKYYNLYTDKDMSESAKRYYANCTWFDEGVGELRKYLKEIGELENTLFIYVNDNGWEQRPDQEFWEDPMRSHNGGDKGKSSIYDMSFRTPIIFTWEGKIAKGKTLNHLMHSADIPATILDYVGIEAPAHFFGKSYKAALEGKEFSGREEIIGNTTTHRDEKAVMGRAVEGYWLRNEDWFFRWNVTDGEIELFDMHNDPNNDTDLAQSHPELLQSMIEKIEHWKGEKGL